MLVLTSWAYYPIESSTSINTPCKSMLPPYIYQFTKRYLTLITWSFILVTILCYLCSSFITGNVNFSSNCRLDLPKVVCNVANLFGWLSSSVWYSCLLAQILKDSFYTQCKGLSITWSWLNFTAASMNGFAVFYWNLPMFVKVGALVMPFLEALVLIQIYYFRSAERNQHSNSIRIHGDIQFSQGAWKAAVSIWIVLFLIGISSYINILPSFIILEMFTWSAIIFWSGEGFFQMFLNWRIDTCEGQSYPAATLAFFGKMFDFFAQWLLVMPGRYLLLSYFSTALGLLNAAQCLYMTQRTTKKSSKKIMHFSVIAFIFFYIYIFMSYVFIFSSFPTNQSMDSESESWLHSDAPRWPSLIPPLMVTAGCVAEWHFATSMPKKDVSFDS